MPDGKKNESILGQIVVAVVVALLAGGTAPWWWDKFFSTGKAPVSTPISTSPSPSTSIQPSIPVPPKDLLELSPEQVNALKNGTQTIIESRRNVDEKILDSIFVGKALDGQKNVIQSLKVDQQYAVWTLYKQEINSPIEVTSDTVKVPQVIIWSATIYSSITRQCVGQFIKYESPQVVTLVKEEVSNQWKISDINFEKGNPLFESCN